MPISQDGGKKPAQVQDSPRVGPAVFEWYENKVQEGLAELYRCDVPERQKITEVIAEMSDSNRFWDLMAAYDGAVMHEKAAGGTGDDALRAFLARIYIAGTMRGAKLLDGNQ